MFNQSCPLLLFVLPFCPIYSDILSDICFDILSDIFSEICSDILSDILHCHFIWRYLKYILTCSHNLSHIFTFYLTFHLAFYPNFAKLYLICHGHHGPLTFRFLKRKAQFSHLIFSTCFEVSLFTGKWFWDCFKNALILTGYQARMESSTCKN